MQWKSLDHLTNVESDEHCNIVVTNVSWLTFAWGVNFKAIESSNVGVSYDLRWLHAKALRHHNMHNIDVFKTPMHVQIVKIWIK